ALPPIDTQRAGELEPRRDLPRVLHEPAQEVFLASCDTGADEPVRDEDALFRLARHPEGVHAGEQRMTAERAVPLECATRGRGRRLLIERERLAVPVVGLGGERAVEVFAL